ncbi:hypothetical protein GCM10027267_24320 [Paramicrobacterium agarici]
MLRAAGSPSNGLRVHIALAASYFGLYALYLTVVPSWGTRYGIASSQAGLLVAVIAVAGLVGDIAVSRVSACLSSKHVILSAIGIEIVGAAFVTTATQFAMFVVGTTLLGLALGLMLSPILSGLSSHAGPDQIRTQSTNAIWQRLAALLAAVFLINVLSASGNALVIAAISILTGMVVLLTLCLPASRERSVGPPSVIVVSFARLIRLIRASRPLQVGLASNATTTLLIIAGASFFPLVLVELQKPALLTYGLLGREFLAITAALVVRRIATRRALGRLWLFAAGGGAVGLAVFPFVESDVILVLAFSLHGAAVGVGIAFGNVMIYDGTTSRTRIHGFAISAMLGRIGSIVLPLSLAVALDLGAGWAMGTLACVVVLVIALCASRVEHA